MIKENLFEQIRKEDVVLWAGAGMSIYAGYPSGNDLRDIIYNDLNPAVRQEIAPSTSLIDMAESYVLSKKGSRNELNTLISNVFRKEPKKLSAHKSLTAIPHIRTIITTNYDYLFEKVYGSDAISVSHSSQVASLQKDKVEIFKAHGDLSDFNSIILTRNDYVRFFGKNQADSLFWNTIKDRIACHCVVFVGYSLEDPNVMMVLDRIHEELGTNRKQHFFVAPNLKPLQITYLDSRNVQYINSTGEKLIKDILSDLHENVVEDFEADKVSLKTASKFLSKQKISAKLSLRDGKRVVEDVYSLDPKQIGRLTFSLSKDDKLNDSLADFMSGEKIGKLEIPKGSIIDATFRLGKTKVATKLKSMTILTPPSGTYVVDIRFNDGFEYESLKVEVYKTTDLLRFHVRLKSVFVEASMTFKGDGQAGHQCTFSYTPDQVCQKMTDQIRDYTLLSKICNEELFNVFYKGKVVHSGNIFIKPLHARIQSFLEFFEACRTIELRFQRVFSNVRFGSIDETACAALNDILTVVNESPYVQSFQVMKITFDTDADEYEYERELVLEASQNFMLITRSRESVELFGEVFDLGYLHVEIVAPLVENRDRIAEGLDDFALIRSKVGYRRRSFRETGLV